MAKYGRLSMMTDPAGTADSDQPGRVVGFTMGLFELAAAGPGRADLQFHDGGSAQSRAVQLSDLAAALHVTQL